MFSDDVARWIWRSMSDVTGVVYSWVLMPLTIIVCAVLYKKLRRPFCFCFLFAVVLQAAQGYVVDYVYTSPDAHWQAFHWTWTYAYQSLTAVGLVLALVDLVRKKATTPCAPTVDPAPSSGPNANEG